MTLQEAEEVEEETPLNLFYNRTLAPLQFLLLL